MRRAFCLALLTAAALGGLFAAQAQRWTSREKAARTAEQFSDQANRLRDLTADRPGEEGLHLLARQLARAANRFQRAVERAAAPRDARDDFAELQRAYVRLRQAVALGSDEKAAAGADYPLAFVHGRGRLAVFRAGRFLTDSNGNGRSDDGDRVYTFGRAGDIPVVGDWDGSGRMKVGVFRNGTWLLDTNGNGTWDRGDQTFEFGQVGDIPVVGDWDGGGRAKLGVYRGDTFLLDYNGTGRWDEGDRSHPFGQDGDWPVVGDWDGRGTTKLGVFRNGTWLLDYNGNGTWDDGDVHYTFGTTGDYPVAGHWDGGARARIGVFRQGAFLADVSGNGSWGAGDATYAFLRAADAARPAALRDSVVRQWDRLRKAHAALRHDMGVTRP